MRRPLMAVCIGFVIVTAVLLLNGCFAGPGLTESGGWLDREVIVTGHVYRKDTKYFYLDSVSIHSGLKESVLVQNQAVSLQQNISPNILLEDNLICEYEEEAPLIGSNVTVRGILSCFLEATNPGEFDSAGYYRSIGICGKLKNVVLIQQSEEYSRWREVLFTLQQYFRARLYNIFPEKEASIMTAMLLGDKSDLDDETKELYQENGIIHILSISGLHITIIGMSIFSMLRRFGVPIWAAASIGGSILLFYGVMTGMSISACRAIGMFLIRMLAEIAGRTYDMLTAMGIMVAGMIGCNPYCMENAGFWLSYGSIVGIGVLYPVLLSSDTVEKVQLYEEIKWKRILRELQCKSRDGLKESIATGASVTLTTLPIQLWFYYEVPTYSILLNVLVLPFMTLVMMSGLIAMLVPGLGIVGTVDCVILGGYEWLCKAFEALPFSKWNPGRPELWQVVIYYGLWLLVVVFAGHRDYKIRMETNKRKKKDMKRKEREKNEAKDWERPWKRRVIRCIPNMMLTIAVMVMGIQFPKDTTITFLDVGQGDCICVQLESGEVYLFDCGSSSRSKVGEYVLKPFLKYSGIQHIDAVFVSHPDEDHCNGIEELLNQGADWGITVGQLVLPDVEGAIGVEKTSDEIQGRELRGNEMQGNELQELAEVAITSSQKQPVQVSTIKAGDYFGNQFCQFLCLHPPKDCTIEDTNAYSQCFYMELEQGFSMLLTGDVEAEGEELLLAELQERNISDIAVLKVAHHGSKNSSGKEILEQIQPDVAIISCGRNNSYGHPHEETLERLSEEGAVILTTPECGAVILEIGKNVEVRSWVLPD